jgi:hypothetical protein
MQQRQCRSDQFKFALLPRSRARDTPVDPTPNAGNSSLLGWTALGFRFIRPIRGPCPTAGHYSGRSFIDTIKPVSMFNRIIPIGLCLLAVLLSAKRHAKLRSLLHASLYSSKFPLHCKHFKTFPDTLFRRGTWGYFYAPSYFANLLFVFVQAVIVISYILLLRLDQNLWMIIWKVAIGLWSILKENCIEIGEYCELAFDLGCVPKMQGC